jgi:uncharacterized Zn finger protein
MHLSSRGVMDIHRVMRVDARGRSVCRSGRVNAAFMFQTEQVRVHVRGSERRLELNTLQCAVWCRLRYSR